MPPPQAQGMNLLRNPDRCRRKAISPSRSSGTPLSTADMVKPGLPVMNADGTPKWRMAPSPHGSYWKEGMKLGYQDVGSATLLKSTPVDRPQGSLALSAVHQLQVR